MRKINYLKKYSLITALFVVFTLAHIAYAIDYAPLEPNAFGPGVVEGANRSLTSFLSAVFSFGIAVAVALALVEIIWGGIIKMTTDSWSGKSEANSKIENAVYGLGVVLVCWLVLYTINPTLVSFSGNTFINPVSYTKPVRNDKTNNFKTQTTISASYFKGGATTTVSVDVARAVNENQKLLDDVNKIIGPLGFSASSPTHIGGVPYVKVSFRTTSGVDEQKIIKDLANKMLQSGYIGDYYASNCLVTFTGFTCKPILNLDTPYFMVRKN